MVPAAGGKGRGSDDRAAAGWSSQGGTWAEHLAADHGYIVPGKLVPGIARQAGWLAGQDIGRGIRGLGRFRIVLVQGLSRRLCGAVAPGP